MKALKIVVIALLVYAGIVTVFESMIGYFQPAQPGSTIVLTTFDASGAAHERVVSKLDSGGHVYVAANHWPRAWYHRVLENPKVQADVDGVKREFRAVPVTGDELPGQFRLVPWVAVVVFAAFGLWIAYFRGWIAPRSALRDRPLLKAFREASPLRYAAIAALRSPALLAAVIVYTLALRLFGVDASFVHMLGVLPVIFFAAAVPTPMRAAAITVWVVLFPEREAQMSAFGFVMHNFFIFFNATIGLLFLRRAKRELLEAS